MVIKTLAAFKLNATGNPIHKSIPIINNRQYTKNSRFSFILKLPGI